MSRWWRSSPRVPTPPGWPRYTECDAYIGGYGTHVLMIEYRSADFTTGCSAYPDYSIVLRDLNLVMHSAVDGVALDALADPAAEQAGREGNGDGNRQRDRREDQRDVHHQHAEHDGDASGDGRGQARLEDGAAFRFVADHEAAEREAAERDPPSA